MTPSHYKLDLDWNSMLLNVGNAAPVLQKLDTYERVSIYEGPIPQRDVEGLRELRRRTNRPIALHFGEPSFPIAVREAMCDGFVICAGVANVLLVKGCWPVSLPNPSGYNWLVRDWSPPWPRIWALCCLLRSGRRSLVSTTTAMTCWSSR